LPSVLARSYPLNAFQGIQWATSERRRHLSQIPRSLPLPDMPQPQPSRPLLCCTRCTLNILGDRAGHCSHTISALTDQHIARGCPSHRVNSFAVLLDGPKSRSKPFHEMPLPRRVGPTAAPPFSPRRRSCVTSFRARASRAGARRRPSAASARRHDQTWQTYASSLGESRIAGLRDLCCARFSRYAVSLRFLVSFECGG
jgi:hypothetical protein